MVNFLTKSNQLKDINSILEQLNSNNKQSLNQNGSGSVSASNLSTFVYKSPSSASSVSSNGSSVSSATSNGILSESNRASASRANVCSAKKFPGETSVRDLEPTLKMIIIKELSAEKVDGNDWRMFAKRIDMNENDIKEWSALKLQYPMARVMSFWSSRPEATVRLLHRHLNALNFGILAKRIENFYQVF
jgi:hypothetical protein